MDPHGDRIVELAAVRFDLAQRSVRKFQSLIDPQRAIPAAATQIHGLSDKSVQREPTAAQILPHFRKWVEPTESLLVAHNARFDLQFLEAGYRRVAVNRSKTASLILKSWLSAGFHSSDPTP